MSFSLNMHATCACTCLQEFLYTNFGVSLNFFVFHKDLKLLYHTVLKCMHIDLIMLTYIAISGGKSTSYILLIKVYME